MVENEIATSFPNIPEGDSNHSTTQIAITRKFYGRDQPIARSKVANIGRRKAQRDQDRLPTVKGLRTCPKNMIYKFMHPMAEVTVSQWTKV